MAHDAQYKDTDKAPFLGRLACPKKGEEYWNRYTHAFEVAERDLDERFLIMERGNE